MMTKHKSGTTGTTVHLYINTQLTMTIRIVLKLSPIDVQPDALQVLMRYDKGMTSGTPQVGKHWKLCPVHVVFL